MPGVLTDTEITEFRGLVEELAMPSTCTIGSSTMTANDSGGYSSDSGDVAVCACRLRSSGLQPSERAVADRLGWAVAYAIDLPYDVTVDPKQSIAIGGRTFSIGGVVDEDAWAMKKVAIVQERG